MWGGEYFLSFPTRSGIQKYSILILDSRFRGNDSIKACNRFPIVTEALLLLNKQYSIFPVLLVVFFNPDFYHTKNNKFAAQ